MRQFIVFSLLVVAFAILHVTYSGCNHGGGHSVPLAEADSPEILERVAALEGQAVTTQEEIQSLRAIATALEPLGPAVLSLEGQVQDARERLKRISGEVVFFAAKVWGLPFVAPAPEIGPCGIENFLLDLATVNPNRPPPLIMGGRLDREKIIFETISSGHLLVRVRGVGGRDAELSFYGVLDGASVAVPAGQDSGVFRRSDGGVLAFEGFLLFTDVPAGAHELKLGICPNPGFEFPVNAVIAVQHFPTAATP